MPLGSIRWSCFVVSFRLLASCFWPAVATVFNRERVLGAANTRGGKDAPAPLLVIAYETNVSRALLADYYLTRAKHAGLEMRLVGLGSHFSGFGSKHALAAAELEHVDPQRLVVLSDYDDVLLNFGQNGIGAISEFSSRFEEIQRAHPSAVVMSGERQCCVGALSFFKPGDKIAADGSRTGRACFSGEKGCVWNPGGQWPWINFMTDLEKSRGFASNRTFLNAGLIAGRAGDLIRVVRAANIIDSEDDQAVFTELMYRRPDMIMIDYNQTLFGNADWEQGYPAGCSFDWSSGERRWRHRLTGTRPLFLHCPGKFYRCFTELARQLSPKNALVQSKARIDWPTKPGHGGFR